MPSHRGRSAAVIETVNQAMNVLDAYWAKHGAPDHRVIAQIRTKLEEHSSMCGDDSTSLLDEAMGDLGYVIAWQGEGIHSLARQGGDLQAEVAGNEIDLSKAS